MHLRHPVSGRNGIYCWNTAASAGGIIINSIAGQGYLPGLVTIGANGTWNNSSNAPVNFRGGITNSGTFTAGTAYRHLIQIHKH